MLLKRLISNALQPLVFRLSKQSVLNLTVEFETLSEAFKVLNEYKSNPPRSGRISELNLHPAEKKNVSKLEKILKKNGSDKGTKHSYAKEYAALFKNFEKNAKILEIGIGNNTEGSVGFMGRKYKPGASLRSWKEFLPDAEIYGADFDSKTLFHEDRISTYLVDQREKRSLEVLAGKFQECSIDLIIDDGLHTPLAAILTFSKLWKLVKPGGHYVIEDVSKISKPFFQEIADAIKENKFRFLDMSHERNQLNNCLAIYQKL